MNNSPIAGAGYLLRGLPLLFKPGIRPYALIPIAINVVLFAMGLWYGMEQFQIFMDWINGFLPSWLQWLEWLLIPLFFVAMVVLVFFTFSMVANIIGAPFNAILAQRVEQHLLGKETADGGAKDVVLKLIPMIMSEIGKVAYGLLWAVPFLILFIIPVINVAAPFLSLIFSAWILAVQYIDIPMANHDMTGRQVRQQLRARRALSLGFGGMTLLMTTLPLFNFLVMPTAVAGATVLWVEAIKER